MYVHEYETTPTAGANFGEPPPAAVVCRLVDTFDGFDVGDYRLKPAHYDRLMTIASALPGLSRLRLFLRVEGHTDSSGPDRMNTGLSFNRANEVRSFLARAGGAAPIQVVGVGEARPRDTNATEQGRRRNRRVEIRVCQLPPPPPPPPLQA